MGTHRMHNIDIDVHGVLHLAGGSDIRQVRGTLSGNQSFLSRWGTWAMRMHYLMWVAMTIFFITLGMLYRGNQDIAKQAAKAEGAAVVLIALPPKILSEVQI